MSNRFRLSCVYKNKLEELGISPLSVLNRAGLPSGLFDLEKILLTTGEFFAFWRALEDVSTNPDTGLLLGNENRVELYDPIAITAIYSKSFRDAITRLARYKKLTCPEEILIIDKKDVSEVRFNWLSAEEPIPDLLIDVCFAWIIGIGRRGAGNMLNPERITLIRRAKNKEMYKEHFKCQVKFNAPHNAIIFKKADLDRQFHTHNPELLSIVSTRLETELTSNLAGQSYSQQVKAMMKRLMIGHRPAIYDVSLEMHISTRTLQRRLTEEGTNFQKLLEEARRELAHHYLLESSLELSETAYLLGYEDANSFFRAFHNWEGATPGQWRTKNISLGARASRSA